MTTITTTAAETRITPAPATPATSNPKSTRRTRRFTPRTAQEVCDFLNGRPVAKRAPTSYPHIPEIGPDGWPPRRFEEGQQPRGTLGPAETAEALGICRGRLRASAKSWGLIPFAYGPRGEAVFWAKHVEKFAESRARRASEKEVEIQLAA